MRGKRTIRKKRTGPASAFSLIEILIVIMILGILTAILVPSISRMKSKAQVVKCISNLRQLGAGITTFSAENDGAFPPSYTPDGNWQQYLQNSSIATKDNAGILPNENYLQNAREILTVYNCPANPGRTGRWRDPSYAYNRALGSDDGNYSRKVRVSNLTNPSQTVVLVDAGHRYDSSYTIDKGPPTIVCYLTDYLGAAYGWERSVNFGIHQAQANFLLADGHIESLTKDQVKKRGDEGSLLWSRENKSGKNYFW